MLLRNVTRRRPMVAPTNHKFSLCSMRWRCHELKSEIFGQKNCRFTSSMNLFEVSANTIPLVVSVCLLTFRSHPADDFAKDRLRFFCHWQHSSALPSLLAPRAGGLCPMLSPTGYVAKQQFTGNAQFMKSLISIHGNAISLSDSKFS